MTLAFGCNQELLRTPRDLSDDWNVHGQELVSSVDLRRVLESVQKLDQLLHGVLTLQTRRAEDLFLVTVLPWTTGRTLRKAHATAGCLAAVGARHLAWKLVDSTCFHLDRFVGNSDPRAQGDGVHNEIRSHQADADECP